MLPSPLRVFAGICTVQNTVLGRVGLPTRLSFLEGVYGLLMRGPVANVGGKAASGSTFPGGDVGIDALPKQGRRHGLLSVDNRVL